MPLDHEMRRTGFTASDMAALLLPNEEKDRHALITEKLYGRIPLPDTEYLDRGKFLERGILDWYSHKTKRQVEPLFDQTFRHPKYPHVLATPDGLVIGESRVVDCKSPGWPQRHLWGPTFDDSPEKVQLQMIVQMEVLDRDRCDIALFADDRLRIIEGQRDRAFGEWICVQAEELWERYVVRKELPPIGGSKISAAWLQRMFPSHKEADIRPATDEEIELLTGYGKLRAEQKRLEKARAKFENQLKLAVADREGLQWSGGRFTWKRTKDGQWIDWQSMAIGLRAHFIKDEEARATLTETYTHTKPGARRIWFRSDDFVEQEEAADAA